MEKVSLTQAICGGLIACGIWLYLADKDDPAQTPVLACFLVVGWIVFAVIVGLCKLIRKRAAKKKERQDGKKAATQAELQQRFTEYEAKRKEWESDSIEAWRKRVEDNAEVRKAELERERKAAAEESERQRLQAEAEAKRLREEEEAREKQRAAEQKAKEDAKRREAERIKANMSLMGLDELLKFAKHQLDELVTEINKGHTHE